MKRLTRYLTFLMLAVFFVGILCPDAYAKNPFTTVGTPNTRWQSGVYGHKLTQREEARSIQQTSDGGYVLAGSTAGSFWPSTNGDYYVVKTDSNGDIP